MESVSTIPDAFLGTDIENCYQCGKCTAGCPVAELTDVMPNQVLRWVQLGHLDQALGCAMIWDCVSCQTCTARCPKSVDCAGVMDVLRQLAAEQGITAPPQRRIVAFQQAFLENIRRNGRINEVELIAEFKTRAFLKDFNVPLLMKDSLLAPKLMQRGKFHVVGEKAKDRGVVKRIFQRCIKNEKDRSV